MREVVGLMLDADSSEYDQFDETDPLTWLEEMVALLEMSDIARMSDV